MALPRSAGRTGGLVQYVGSVVAHVIDVRCGPCGADDLVVILHNHVKEGNLALHQINEVRACLPGKESIKHESWMALASGGYWLHAAGFSKTMYTMV
jgi:hypothetical protein